MRVLTTIRRGFDRLTKSDGAAVVSVEGFRHKSLYVSLCDDHRYKEERKRGAVKLRAEFTGEEVDQVAAQLAGVSLLETKLTDAVRMGVEAQAQDNATGATEFSGQARAYLATLRIIKARGNDIVGGTTQDEEKLAELWAAAHDAHEARARTMEAIGNGIRAVLKAES